jgi:hypothetical protein
VVGHYILLRMVEGVSHRKLIAIIRVGHVKICINFFKGMCIKIRGVFTKCVVGMLQIPFPGFKFSNFSPF